ncbi:MAG: sel1 repeat family protein [Akkermansia sp.]|nr:sel1 repeat family protein [Akkermansia sp.]
MKKIALITAVALSSFAAIGAESQAAAKADTAAAPAAPCCDKSAAACPEQCTVDMETITVLAENGDPIAQYTIAWIADNGTAATPADPEKAKEMYAKALPGLEKAAKEGDPKACYALAHMYAEGKGVEKDHEKAKAMMKWCKECCDKKGSEKPSETGAATPAAQPSEM